MYLGENLKKMHLECVFDFANSYWNSLQIITANTCNFIVIGYCWSGKKEMENGEICAFANQSLKMFRRFWALFFILLFILYMIKLQCFLHSCLKSMHVNWMHENFHLEKETRAYFNVFCQHKSDLISHCPVHVNRKVNETIKHGN